MSKHAGVLQRWRRRAQALCRIVVLAALPAVVAVSALAALPVIDDSRVDDVRIEGNRVLGSATLRSVLSLRVDGPLTRALVLQDVAAIEALYRKSGQRVQVWPELTHPGENEGQARTTLTYRLIEGAAPRHYDDSADPLANYYGNTLVCAAAQSGNDLCHLWLNPDGSFINFDAGEAKAGHYVTGPVRADGKVPVCQYWDTPLMVSPAEVAPPRGPPPAAGAAAGSPPAAMPSRLCKNINYRTVCDHNVDVSRLSAEDLALVPETMADKFYQGNCYPIGPHDVGDVWFEADDPFPGQLGQDKVFLIKGRQ